MSKALSFVGKVAGIVASVAALIPGGQPIAAAASVVALTASVGAQVTATKPPVRGSVSDITIGADQPTPYMIGDTYSGGALVHKTGYGSPINKVQNPYLAMAVTYSAGGPIAGVDQYLADFEPLSIAGGNGEAQGYFSEILFVRFSPGPLLQSTALTGPFGSIPGWTANAKLSGKAHALWSLKWDSKNGKYQSGAPQLGIRGRGVLTWDPRKDSTWTGGSGPQRWASPKNRAAFDAARATWVYTNRPGLHALRYTLGTWERDLNSASSDYVLTFGIGIPVDGVVVEDFVALENICEANGWTVSGVLFEPGDKMANLKRILEAGGAEPCWKGGRLGLRSRAPRLSLDTITRDDLADGELRAAGHQMWEQRINAVIPKYRSPAHKWSMQGTDKRVVAAYVINDGEEKPREVPFECVTDPSQASELALYTLYDSREQGPITIPVKPRLRRYMGGDRLTLSPEVRAELGLLVADVVILDRAFDPETMTGTLTLITDNSNKHAAALGATGASPPAIAIPTTEQYDGAQAIAAAFVHFAYAATDGGTTDFSLSPSVNRGWLGTYSDNDPVGSTDPARYAWALVRGPAGAGAYSLINVANTIVGTSSVRKVSGGNDTWNGRATTGESYRSASVSAVLCPDSFVALNIVTAGEALDYTSLEYSIHRSGNGNYVGVFRGTNGIASTNRAPVAGARATVTSDGATVRYSYNGEELWSHPVLTPGELVQGAFELIRLDSEITNITFSPAGLAGNSGAPGANAYIHTAFANSADGTVDFTTGAPAGRAFIGTYTDNAAADSTLPGSYEWTAYKGPPGFGLNPRGTAIVAGNTVIKATGANLWDSDCYSTEGWRGGCQLSFRAPVAGSNGMAGINTDPTTDGGYTSLDHAFQFADNGIVYIYESDVGYLTGISYDASTLFQIRYDNKSVIYLINGAIVRTVAKAADLIFYFDSSLCNVGTRITEITWGAAGAAGGDGVTPVLVTAQPEAVTIQTDAGGTPVAGTFPIPIGNAATKGGAGVAISSVTIVTASGVTASVSGSTLNITGYSGGISGEVVYDVVAAGQTVRKRVTVAVTASGSNGAVQQVLRVTTPQLTWTAYQQHGGTVALNASSSGKLQLNLTGSMRVDNSGNDLRFQSKLQYRVSAGTWTDVPGSEAISTRSELLLDPTRIIAANVNGSGPYNLTGLTADGAYEVRALTRKYDGSATTTQIVNLSISALQIA